jgi:DNA repair exonuclease SbcCD ATPase subunit
MKTENYKQIALIVGIIVALMMSGIFLTKNRTLNKNLKVEKLTSETLLSEKLALDRSLEKLNAEMSDLKGKNKQLDLRVDEVSKQLDEKVNELRKAMSENATLRGFRAKARELEALTTKLNAELVGVRSEMEREKQRFASEKKELNDRIAVLTAENNQLASTNAILGAMAGNNHRIETVRGKNDKLTVKARRTQKLIFSLDIPGNVGNNIQFELVCPDGKVYESKDNKSASVKVNNSTRNFFASNNDILTAGTKTVEMVYKPEEKLSKGTYEFKVYNDGRYIGSSSFRLR